MLIFFRTPEAPGEAEEEAAAEAGEWLPGPVVEDEDGAICEKEERGIVR